MGYDGDDDNADADDEDVKYDGLHEVRYIMMTKMTVTMTMRTMTLTMMMMTVKYLHGLHEVGYNDDDDDDDDDDKGSQLPPWHT